MRDDINFLVYLAEDEERRYDLFDVLQTISLFELLIHIVLSHRQVITGLPSSLGDGGRRGLDLVFYAPLTLRCCSFFEGDARMVLTLFLNIILEPAWQLGYLDAVWKCDSDAMRTSTGCAWRLVLEFCVRVHRLW
jgi:hypothetical protein